MSASPRRANGAFAAPLVALLVASTSITGDLQAAELDLCGCKDHPQSLGSFDPAKQESWPPGAVMDEAKHVLTIPLPPDGVLVFDELYASRWGDRSDYQIRFEKNARNTPVTILVPGDITIDPYVTLHVDGNDGASGNQHVNGRGGEPGPGGFRGGDGAYMDVNGATDGGEGQGPGGGEPGIGKEMKDAGLGKFGGSKELRPLIGGSGGGGGGSKDAGNCSASGGGGGGGAILLAANGTITINGAINADGGRRGYYRSNGECSTYGGAGSGGAIRLIAQTVKGGGSVVARGSRGDRGGQPGVIRIESLNDDELRADWISPTAIRTNVIGPIVNPVRSEVAITAIGGKAVPETLKGIHGDVDLVVKAPGKVKVQVRTQGVPAGTTVEVAMKPKVGGTALRDRAELNASGCNPQGECTAFISFELPSGTYFAEARATFETP